MKLHEGIPLGSPLEGGYVFAWRLYPSDYAVKNSGAKFGVIISFETSASFVDDIGIEDPKVKRYLPVVSSRTGPIYVSNVKLVGVTK